jgi:hypothetical protein
MSVILWRNNFCPPTIRLTNDSGPPGCVQINFEKQADVVEALRLLRTALQKAISVEWSGDAQAT